jgi:hypothetical protein
MGRVERDFRKRATEGIQNLVLLEDGSLDMKLLRPNKQYTWLLMVASLACILFGIWSLWRFEKISSWPLIAAGGTQLFALIVWWMPSSSYLVLREDGFYVRYLFNSHFFKWDAVNRFFTDKDFLGRPKVSFFTNSQTGAMQLWKLPDDYGMETADLINLLYLWHDRAMSRPGYSELDHSTEGGEANYALGAM